MKAIIHQYNMIHNRRSERQPNMNEREKKFFLQIVKTMDNNQLQWVLEHDYPEWEKEIAKAELEKRLGGNEK
jgi:succinate dehydrogenase flavin-adding protein (antitoxin of CptAB toxin-antitoxin module)